MAKPPATAARPGAKLREIWNECCPSAPTDESIESHPGWRQWIESAEFVEKFREIATLAAACREGGLGWMSLVWLMGKKDGNALWNWQRLLQGDFTPRQKGVVAQAKTDGDALIQAVMADTVKREKQTRDRLRREWEQKNREREEDGLAPKPKPQKLVDLEAKHGEN